jgi:hypothetical protein
MDTDQGGLNRPEAIGVMVTQIRAVLAGAVFRVQNEAALQELVANLLIEGLAPYRITISREVPVTGGRLDILAESCVGVRLVLELKMKAGAAAVERQAQRYALAEDIDGVAIVTTSYRLAHELRRVSNPGTLGGKPFQIINLRTF